MADETGLPAVASILDHRPPGTPVRVFLEVTASARCQPLVVGQGVDLSWLLRDACDAGPTELLIDAVRAGVPPTTATYTWGGAESRAMSAVRRYLRGEVGLTREQVSMTPYWRHAGHAGDATDSDG